jgi:predicted polyphosphate/ATP-dependent NAD kinase
MRRIGFIVNPVAGMGGTVGLKGTDGMVAEAIRRGAEPHAADRAAIALGNLKQETSLIFLTCSGSMGEDILNTTGVQNYVVRYRAPVTSTADDTKRAATAFLREGVDLILFCGGDGTARDIFDAVGRNIPILGIPAGVKMYSGVFAVDPATAGDIIVGEQPLNLRDAEVLDVDEEAYRAGELRTHLYGIARVPAIPGRVQVAKQVFDEADEERAKEEIARFIAEIMQPDTLYILGAGTTTEAIARKIGVKKTLLGVDAVKNGQLVATDADEKTLLGLVEKEKDVRIIISLIGAQGFLFGRGNQQLSAGIVRRMGIQNIIIVATPHKLRETPVLYIDTGDPVLDESFGESVQVVSGYRIAQRKRIHRSRPEKEEN